MYIQCYHSQVSLFIRIVIMIDLHLLKLLVPCGAPAQASTSAVMFGPWAWSYITWEQEAAAWSISRRIF